MDDIRGLFLSIKEMCEDYNRKGVLDLISEMLNCSAEAQAALDKIIELVRHSDFEEAEETIDAFLSSLPAPSSEAVNFKQATLDILDKGIPGLDIPKGLERYEGDEEVYQKVLRSYSGSVRALLDAIKTADSETLNTYRIKVHGIKGASYDMFAESLGKKAEALENAASNGDLSFINQHNPLFHEAANKLLDDIDRMVLAIGKLNPKPKKDKPDSQLLSKLAEACKNFYMREVDLTMTEIEKYQYEADDGLAEWLRKKVDMMNYDQIIEKLTEGA